MNCQNCDQLIEAGAAFCGNCGRALSPANARLTQAAAAPSYTQTTPAQRSDETKALMSVLFGITGLVGAIFMALLGIVLGIAGLVVGTMSRRSSKRSVSMMGLVFSSFAILLGMAVWVYAIKQTTTQTDKGSGAGTSAVVTSSAAEISTPCYSLGFIDTLNISSTADSCNISAFNGETFASSTNAYKVYASQTQISDTNSFMSIAKTAIEKDVKNSLPGFTIVDQKVSTFAGSPAYIVKAVNKKQNIAVIEAAVLREVSTGDNIFILMHANNGDDADLAILESGWQWK